MDAYIVLQDTRQVLYNTQSLCTVRFNLLCANGKLLCPQTKGGSMIVIVRLFPQQFLCNILTTRFSYSAAETSRHHTISLFGLSPSCQSFVLTILLYIKERRSKFKLVLDNNAHCFKADFMLVHAVSETLVKACKCLYPCVECLMPGPGSTLLLALYKSIVNECHISNNLMHTKGIH